MTNIMTSLTLTPADINNVKNIIETAEKALDLYNRVVDTVIPWATFENTIKEMTKFQTDGVFQDSWHSLVNFYAASFTGFSGFNVTSPIASQF